jgi:hypothetical protein
MSALDWLITKPEYYYKTGDKPGLREGRRITSFKKKA